ncbi:hypothetical protein [Draconibacterium halophilum]|uniref:Uncharacterized protein n=1 Tax=Draconibacterium halophilum TaxID=2706887 RepID=A0A6C0RAA7_9BACT|nr:hypothetical protein [Draconibacterium halophilum]QIA07019.1 hypothetical protein G0Q07_04375 [Draconibacterium halophilum]
MKNFKILLFSFLLVAFIAPNVSNAQASREAEIQFCNIEVEGDRVLFVDAYVLVSASGNVQLKATFDLGNPKEDIDLSDFWPTKGKQKITLNRVAVQFKLDGKIYHFVSEEKARAIVDSDGYASVVMNWQESD